MDNLDLLASITLHRCKHVYFLDNIKSSEKPSIVEVILLFSAVRLCRTSVLDEHAAENLDRTSRRAKI